MTTEDTSLAWQRHCTKELLLAVTIGGLAGRTHWNGFRDNLPVDGKRIVIADADLSGKGLEGFDLSRCWIGRTSFAAANLTGANFYQTIFRHCDATGANIEAAIFRNADMQGDGLSLAGAKFDSNTLFEVALNRLPDLIEPGLQLAAARARSERRWRYRKSQSRLVRALLWLTQHGFSVTRLAWVGLATVIVFALVFITFGYSPSISLLASVKYFLGLNDTFSTSAWSSLIGSIETLSGMLFFAVLTTILVTSFFEKN